MKDFLWTVLIFGAAAITLACAVVYIVVMIFVVLGMLIVEAVGGLFKGGKNNGN